ncbi:hypothetical protein L2Y90_25505 [Burkholderia pyrrocinia]|uniref:hypothetical protein n=1 Tax=Burkholderia pyrrocinia TaxID=60550 RepID=UPI00215AE115|nr:hypothetical protein [Burkholderia pyrrocinia]UVE67489.1 hypothetical protein L2Y90_25505 [Burkholderia pyrrocinia]
MQPEAVDTIGEIRSESRGIGSRIHCGQLSRNAAIPRFSSFFSASPIARPRHLAYGAGRPRSNRRADTRPSSRTTAVRAVPAAHRLRDAARRHRALMRKEA